MGSNPKETQGQVTPRREDIYNQTGEQRQNLWGGPTNLEREYTPISQNFYNAYQSGTGQNMGDYTSMMGGYKDWQNNVANPTVQAINQRQAPNFTYQNVAAPTVTAQTIGAPRNSAESLAGYRDFAQTGGYTPTDITDIRARGIAPIRAAYGNTMQNLSRSRALGGQSGSPNYIAAVSRAQRELPQQLADATQGVNAQLAESIRTGKLQGLQGMTGITEGEAGRTLTAAQANQQANLSAGQGNQQATMQASLANQQANLRAQELTEQGISAKEARQIAAAELGLKGLQGQSSLYSATPGLASTFGNQALEAYGQRNQLEQLRNQYGLGLVGQQLSSLGDQGPYQKPWWQQGIDMGLNIASQF